jgi:hypothetical protein
VEDTFEDNGLEATAWKCDRSDLLVHPILLPI